MAPGPLSFRSALDKREQGAFVRFEPPDCFLLLRAAELTKLVYFFERAGIRTWASFVYTVGSS